MDAPPAYNETDSFQATVEYGAQGEGAPSTAEVNPVQAAPQINNNLGFCTKCGNSWKAGDVFCAKCGNRKDDGGGSGGSGQAPVELAVSSGLSVNQPQTVTGVMQVNSSVPIKTGNGHIIDNKLFINYTDGKALPDRIINEVPEVLAQKGITLDVWQDWMNRFSDMQANSPSLPICCYCLLILMMITVMPLLFAILIMTACPKCCNDCCAQCEPAEFAEQRRIGEELDKDINGSVKDKGMLFAVVVWPRIDPLHRDIYQQQNGQRNRRIEPRSRYLMFTLAESETAIWAEKKKPGQLAIATR